MKKILAVDDSVSIRKSISFILGNEGYEEKSDNEDEDRDEHRHGYGHHCLYRKSLHFPAHRCFILYCDGDMPIFFLNMNEK